MGGLGGGFLVTDDEDPDMDGTRAVVVALLLCLAPLGGITAGAQQGQDNATMSVVSQGDGAEYLAPPSEEIDRSGQETVSIDVAGAVGANVGEVRATYYRVSLQRAYREAESTQERRTVVRNGTQRLGERVEQLERRDSQVIQRYSDGEIGESALLKELAVLDQDARSLEESIVWLETRADNLGMDDVETELSLQRARLRPLQGPVRGDVDAAISGERDARVHVEVSGGGVVLASVEENNGEVTYLREAYDPSARTSDFSDRSDGGLAAAEEQLRQLYPWVTNNSTPTAAPVGPDYARLWRFTYSHPHGSLETYLDVETDRVLLERQYKEPELVPTTGDEETEGDLRMVVNRTRAGGPLGVAVYDDTTGEPVDAEVTVNGDAVGWTDEDRLWTVAPRGNGEINATYAGETVTYRGNFR